ncbi:MAG: group I intron-associated PD-(D/E)XK endonuclease [Raineya sp.]|jgi:hypothetical protein|nr:group I intron-associated PD-(D/E)XK endonuclease [Raineya sp.]
MSKKKDLYLGKAGHLYAMAEFLMKGWNVAIPEVDTGDDIFVVEDDNNTFRRVQVKTATAKLKSNNYQVQYNLPITQLKNISNVLLHYIFVIRYNDDWQKLVIIKQDTLLDYYENQNLGSKSKDGKKLILTFIFSSNGILTCSKINLSNHIADFADFPTPTFFK